MKTIDIGNYNLDIQENSLSLHKQLNDILFHKNKQENNNVFIRSNNRDTIVSNDILNIIQDARSRCSSVLYLRGTSIEYMNNAITKGKISDKIVNDWWEDDSGQVAVYRIPTGANNIPNEEFLINFFYTILSSISYGMEHIGIKIINQRISLILFTPHNSIIREENNRASNHGKFFELLRYNAGGVWLDFNDQRFPVFNENRTNINFENSIKANNGIILHLPPLNPETNEQIKHSGILNASPITGGMEKFDQFKFAYAHIATIKLLQEIHKII